MVARVMVEESRVLVEQGHDGTSRSEGSGQNPVSRGFSQGILQVSFECVQWIYVAYRPYGPEGTEERERYVCHQESDRL